jgi:hypothetical protein
VILAFAARLALLWTRIPVVPPENARRNATGDKRFAAFAAVRVRWGAQNAP